MAETIMDLGSTKELICALADQHAKRRTVCGRASDGWYRKFWSGCCIQGIADWVKT
jgi:hypothetical protein